MKYLLTFIFLLFFVQQSSTDTLISLTPGETAPSNFEELWQDFEPRSEPLDTEVLSQWEEDGAVIKVVRYRAGIFKGQKSMVAAVYGYPIGGENLPALVNVHGGGQYADANAVISNAKRGYATISVSWAGRLTSSKYRVDPAKVKLFWANKTEDPNYALTTDWGAVDGYHAPCRNKKSNATKVTSNELTLDEIDSPRNSLWFLATIAARRAITFLEQQPNVDSDRIGIYGHSMGGKITVLTAATDKRLKVAVPTCGGISDNLNESELFDATLGDHVNLSHISCPVFFLSPSNDFHGDVHDLPEATQLIKSTDYGISSSPHNCHQDPGVYIVAGFKYLDHYLKGAARPPKQPKTDLNLHSDDGIPTLSVTPDSSLEITAVDIFYTQQGRGSKCKDEDANPRFKFWHHASTQNEEGVWSGNLPVFDVEKPLWVYANVTYRLEAPESATNYYYKPFTVSTMNISSLVEMVSSQALIEANVKPTLKKSNLIEDFAVNWEKGWFTYDLSKWAIKTNKLYHPIWHAPSGDAEDVKLVLEVKCEQQNTLAVRINSFAATVDLVGGNQVERVDLLPSDFKDVSGSAMEDWSGIQQLELAPLISISSKFNDNGIRKTKRFKAGSANWKGPAPEFKKLRWSVVDQ